MNYLHPDIYLTKPHNNHNDNILNAKIYDNMNINTKRNYLQSDIYTKEFKVKIKNDFYLYKD